MVLSRAAFLKPLLHEASSCNMTFTYGAFSFRRVPQSVLQVKFSAICQVLLNIMAAKPDTQSTALLKSVSFNCFFWRLLKGIKFEEEITFVYLIT